MPKPGRAAESTAVGPGSACLKRRPAASATKARELSPELWATCPRFLAGGASSPRSCVLNGLRRNPSMYIFQRVLPWRKPKALFEKPAKPFKSGDRVRCMVGDAQGQTGTVVRRPYNLRITTHAGPDQV